jgi:hypothetical protein
VKVCAFDPGISGAAALLDHDLNRRGVLTYHFVEMVDLPSIPDGETRRQPDAAFIGALLERWDPDEVVIENVRPAVHGNKFGGKDGAAMSSMSPSDAFRFGLNCGILRGVVKAYGYEPVMVDPRTWTAALKVKGGAKNKAEHARVIKLLVPSAAPWITLAKHDGRADSACMAYWYAQKRGML